MPMTRLLGGLFLILGSSAATEGDPTCKNGDDCMYDTLKQDLSALFQSKNAQILTASVPTNDAPVVTSDQMKVFVRPASQKLAEMNATMTALKALSAATPEVNIVVQGMIDSINTNIKPHIITDHNDTQTLVDTTISTLSTRTTDAVEKKKDAVAADNTLVQCYAEQRRLLVDHENGTIEEARLKGEMDNTCSVVALKPKTYAFPPELKKDLTCDFSVGDCTDVRDIRKAEHDEWLNELPVAEDKKSYDDAHAACEAAKLAHANQVASCTTMWSNFVSKNEDCLYALKAQQLAICMFGDSLHYKCETKSDYDTLIRDIDGVNNSDSTSDRAKEWEAVNKLECMLDAFIGGAIFDNAMIAKCTKNETDAKADFELKVGIIDKKTEEYTWLISGANFTCLETAITFSGDKWSVPPQGDLTNHSSSAYTMVTGYEYDFESDVNKAPFDFCVPSVYEADTEKTTTGNNGAAYCSAYCARNWNNELPSSWSGACCLSATQGGHSVSCKKSGGGPIACVCKRDDAHQFIAKDDKTGGRYRDERYVCAEDDINALLQSTTRVSARLPAMNDSTMVADQPELSVRPATLKLAEMNATFSTLKALSGATPEVNTVVKGMIDTINDEIKPHIKADHIDTQELVDATISTLSTRTIDAVDKKEAAVAADEALDSCYFEQRRLLGLHETCTSELAKLFDDKENTTNCNSIYLLPPPAGSHPTTYSVPDNLKLDLTIDFSAGDGTQEVKKRSLDHDEWLFGLSIVGDKVSYDTAHASCEDATERYENKTKSCNAMWNDFEGKHAQCLYSLKAQQLAICMFGDSLQYKCETKSEYDKLIIDIDGAGTSHSESDRMDEWTGVSKLECMLDKFVGGANFDNEMVEQCTNTDVVAQADYEQNVGEIDKKTADYTSLTTGTKFTCAETAITFSGVKWTVPFGGELADHKSNEYTSETGYEYAVKLASSESPFTFCLPRVAQTTCGITFECGGEELRKPANTTCYVDGGCTAADCCVRVAVCGDHTVDTNEDCDDGNTVPGDGCSAVCTTEAAVNIVVTGYGTQIIAK